MGTALHTRQLTLSTMKPPKNGPMSMAADIMVPTRPRYTPAFCLSYISRTIVKPTANTAPLTRPQKMLAMMMAIMFGAKTRTSKTMAPAAKPPPASRRFVAGLRAAMKPKMGMTHTLKIPLMPWARP